MASIPISIMISTMTPILISIPGWGFAGIIWKSENLKHKKCCKSENLKAQPNPIK